MINLHIYTQRPNEEETLIREVRVNPDVIMFYYREETTKKVPIIGSENNVTEYTRIRINEGDSLYAVETPEEIDAILRGRPEKTLGLGS